MIIREYSDGRILSQIVYCGQNVLVGCDGKCNKAWGTSVREKVILDPENEDDYRYLTDSELGDAPENPGTTEGASCKPLATETKHNKWCVRECERSQIENNLEDLVLYDFDKEYYNVDYRTRNAKLNVEW